MFEACFAATLWLEDRAFLTKVGGGTGGTERALVTALRSGLFINAAFCCVLGPLHRTAETSNT